MTKSTMRNKAPCPPAILIALAVRRCDTKHIAQCSMPRATPEATGCRHWATTHSVLPQHLPGQQANKQQSTITPTKLAVSMAIAMWRYETACIAQWRRSRATLEATGCHHRASTCSDSHQSDMPTPVFPDVFYCQIVEKGHKAIAVMLSYNIWLTNNY